MTETDPGNSHFDIERANKQRLDWRLGDEAPTERALGRDEGLKREVEGEVNEALQAKEIARARLDQRLGGTASKPYTPEATEDL